ncbi:hypothetical protein RRG08_033438 [Elysia crispata]|uniref:Uncharacterized protein n=1 Tax=Elysia crispata TaxID=231223 RepID=A0AAE1E4F5_9GAST|nr:hypothetical protein RRG08_033438 [Elysia crispata]
MVEDVLLLISLHSKSLFRFGKEIFVRKIQHNCILITANKIRLPSRIASVDFRNWKGSNHERQLLGLRKPGQCSDYPPLLGSRPATSHQAASLWRYWRCGPDTEQTSGDDKNDNEFKS